MIKFDQAATLKDIQEVKFQNNFDCNIIDLYLHEDQINIHQIF